MKLDHIPWAETHYAGHDFVDDADACRAGESRKPGAAHKCLQHRSHRFSKAAPGNGTSLMPLRVQYSTCQFLHSFGHVSSQVCEQTNK